MRDTKIATRDTLAFYYPPPPPHRTFFFTAALPAFPLFFFAFLAPVTLTFISRGDKKQKKTLNKKPKLSLLTVKTFSN